MQTTLRIEDEIYRKAKAEAAREGITLTRFIEEALRLRLGREASGEQNEVRGDFSALVERLERLFELADERDRFKKGSAGPFSRQELYAERLERFR